MGFDLKEFTTDEVKELEGIWVYFDVEETQGILIARAWNENFMKAFRKFPHGFQNRVRRGSVDKKTDKKVWHKLLSETILLDWKGISDEGKSIKYSPELAAKKMSDYKEFVKFVWETASEDSFYITEDDSPEDDEKNSPASSATA